MCTARGSTSLQSILLRQGRPPSTMHSWHQKTRDTGLPDGEDRIPLCSLVLTQYRRVADGQTDRRTDGRVCRIAYVGLHNALARCKNRDKDMYLWLRPRLRLCQGQGEYSRGQGHEHRQLKKHAEIVFTNLTLTQLQVITCLSLIHISEPTRPY